MTKKIADLERVNGEMTKRHNEKVKALKDEVTAEYSEMLEKLSADKATLEAKLESKR
jgi:hypothetical protein